MKGRPPGSKNKEAQAPDLLVIPRRIKKEIGVLATASGVSPAQVLIDILDGGLINAREMYRTLIEYRKSLREQLDGTDTNDDAAGLDGNEAVNGSDNVGVDGENMGMPHMPALRPDSDGPSLAPVGPGLSAESDAAVNGDRGDVE